MQGPRGGHADGGGVVVDDLLVVGARTGEGEPRPVVREEVRVGWTYTELRKPGAPISPS